MTQSAEYSISPVSKDIFDQIPKQHPYPVLVNEFFYIEALLRTSKSIKAFSEGGLLALERLFQEHGIYGHAPLSTSHHALLLSSKPMKSQQEKPDDACLDKKFGLHDLSALANQSMEEEPNPSTPVQRGNGITAVMLKLKQNDPRYLFLEIDLSHHVNPLGDRIKKIILERKRIYEMTPKTPSPEITMVGARRIIPIRKIYESWENLSRPYFVDIKAWLAYFQCYDQRQIYGDSYGKIDERIYDDTNSRYHGLRKNAKNRSLLSAAAVKRTLGVIQCAGDKIWPPPERRKTKS